MYDEGLGQVHLPSPSSSHPQLASDSLGRSAWMPRRAASYDPEFAIWNVLGSIGAFMLGVASIPFILNMASPGPGSEGSPNPWRAIGREWLLPSPPPAENFEDDIHRD